MRNVTTIALLACTMLLSCSDPEAPKVDPPSKNPPTDLSVKEHVLENLVRSYLTRDVTQYQRILDPDHYQFFFSTGDVHNGLPADGWDLTQDVAATTNLLNVNNPAPNRIVSIDLEIAMSDLVWREDADTTIGDTLSVVTTTYSFTMRTANDISYITSGTPQVEFALRNVGTVAAPQWRLVYWHDLGDPGGATSSASAVETTTWGRVKALYSN